MLRVVKLISQNRGKRPFVIDLRLSRRTPEAFKNTRSLSYANGNNCQKLSYFHKACDIPLEYQTLGQVLETAANKWPERPVIISVEENVTITFSELLQKADELAASFKEVGLERGDKIGIWTTNCSTWPIIKYAAMRGGFVLVTMNPLYKKNELEHSINKADMKAIVLMETSGPLNFYKTVCEVAPEIKKCVPGDLKAKNVPTLKTVVVLTEKPLEGCFNLKSLVDRANPQAIQRIGSEQNLIQPEDICNIQFTSGTTNNPKAVLLSHFAFINGARIGGRRLNLTEDYMNICVQLPFFHVFACVGLTTASILFGTTMVIPAMLYNPKLIYNTIQKEKCEFVFGTPTMFVDMIATSAASGGQPPKPLKTAFTGGAPASPQFFADLKKKLKLESVLTGFGLTESAGVGFSSTLNGASETQDNVGTLFNHLQVKIIDSKGKVVPMGQSGELCLKGFCTMNGYLKDEKKTKEAIDKDGWLKTGDLAELQEDGTAKIVGRIKDVIIRGGENVYPKEIEDIVNTYDNVLESHVFGISHDRLGEDVCIAIRLKDGKSLHSGQFDAFCKEKLSAFKIPKHVRIVTEFPKTATGKIQKFKLKEMMESGSL